MNVNEAKDAIRRKLFIKFKDGKGEGGVPTCLSDDESGLYYRYGGASLTLGFAPLEGIEVDESLYRSSPFWKPYKG